MFKILIAIAIILFLRNRIKSAHRQRQKEELLREIIRRVDQKRKLDALYGRNKED